MVDGNTPCQVLAEACVAVLPRAAHSHCAAVGTLELRPGARGIAGGCYDDPDWVTVETNIWTRSARSDICYPNHVKVYEEALL